MDARFSYQPGQAALLGPPGESERTPYSIASSPEESTDHCILEFLVKTDNTEWGSYLSTLRRGVRLAVRGPVGSFVFPPDPIEKQFLFVAGGTGIAPLRSMIRHALIAHHDRRLHLLYSARTPSDFAYLPELKRYAREGRLKLVLTATREVTDRWPGERGRITSDRVERLLETPETLCFVCGPAAMVDDVPRMLMKLGVDRRRIRIEEW